MGIGFGNENLALGNDRRAGGGLEPDPPHPLESCGRHPLGGSRIASAILPVGRPGLVRLEAGGWRLEVGGCGLGVGGTLYQTDRTLDFHDLPLGGQRLFVGVVGVEVVQPNGQVALAGVGPAIDQSVRGQRSHAARGAHEGRGVLGVAHEIHTVGPAGLAIDKETLGNEVAETAVVSHGLGKHLGDRLDLVARLQVITRRFLEGDAFRIIAVATHPQGIGRNQ